MALFFDIHALINRALTFIEQNDAVAIVVRLDFRFIVRDFDRLREHAILFVCGQRVGVRTGDEKDGGEDGEYRLLHHNTPYNTPF